MQADAKTALGRLAWLEPERRRLLFVEHGFGAAVVNFALNAAIAWLVFPAAPVPLWGTMSIAGDTLATGFLLPFVTCLVVDRSMRAQVARGRVRALPPEQLPKSPWASWSSARRGLALGAMCVLLAAIPVVACLASAGVADLPRWSFVCFKAAFAAALGAVVTPPIAWWALVRASRSTLPAPDRPGLESDE